jgi:GNAT superfamily N-acetyltransferase
MKDGLRLLDLHGPGLDAATRERVCRLFHEAVYVAAFPRAEHAENPDIWLPLLAATPPAPRPLLHIALAVRDGVAPGALGAADIAGGILFEYFRASGCALITYVCVAPAARRQGVARALIGRAIETCRALGAEAGLETLVFAETENPARLPPEPEAAPKAHARLVTLDALGFQHLPIAYRQPPLAPLDQGGDWDDTLLLLAHAPDGDRAVPRARLAAFLAEFEASLAHNHPGVTPPPHDPFAEVADPIASRPTILAMPREARPPLGQAGAVSLRFTFFRGPETLHPLLGKATGAAVLRPVPLADVLAEAQKPERAAMRRFFAPMRSFTADITISEEGGRKLPIVTACELPPPGMEGPAPLTGFVRFPETLVTEWEGERVETALGAARLPVRIVDTLGLFATNHIAYSLTLVFDGGEGRVPVDIGRLLALLSFAGSAGERVEAEGEIRFELGGGQDYALHELATARMRAFCLHRLPEAERAALRAGWAARDGARPIPPLALPEAHEEVFSAVLRPIVAMLGAPPAAGELADVRLALCTLGPADLQGATAEITGLDRFEEVRRAILLSQRYEAPFSDFTRQVAGLAQVILDYHDQDRHEVNDSLHAAQLAGGYVHFVHRHTLVRLYQHSRSFERMKFSVGGCPYFHLTTLCAAFNERLLADANRWIAQKRPDVAAVRLSLALDGSQHEEAARELDERFRFFERYEADAVPDLFRYETESLLFRTIERLRGLERQRETGRRLLERIESTQRDGAALGREWVEAMLAAAVFMLTLWQVFGVMWDAGGQELDRMVGEWLGGVAPVGMMFRVLSAPMLVLTLGLTIYILASWIPAAMRRRRDAPGGVPPALQWLLWVSAAALVLALAWKLLVGGP